MLFNSLQFIFLYLPATLLLYYLIIKIGFRNQIFLFLVVASLIFYAAWNPPYVLLLVSSMGANYIFGAVIQKRYDSDQSTLWVLSAGILANVAALFYFKYANFFIDNINLVSGTNYNIDKIILPLAISFYTLQQIAFLIDISRGEVRASGISKYATFVIFFPQLVAGPIVHYKDMMPQFFGRKLGRFASYNISIGLTIFAIGLFKKTVIADSAALYASPVFATASTGNTIDFFDAWTAAICYTIQLYFDFSGYSDMAIGLARMFGIRLTPNFHSPLRAPSIIEYWRRWHMTLQQFISTYMHQPMILPLTRIGAVRGFGRWKMYWLTTAAPTVLLMVIIGLWHGASWTFVVFGLMHGVYLAINEAWKLYRRKSRKKNPPNMFDLSLYHGITLLCILLGNVMFRADSISSAVIIWRGMFDITSISNIVSIIPTSLEEVIMKPFALVFTSVVIVSLLPNTQQIMGRYSPVLNWNKWKKVAKPTLQWQWRANALGALFTGTVLFFGIAFISRGQSEFIYFNF